MATQIANINDLRASLAAKLQDPRNTLPPSSNIRIKAKKTGFDMPDGSTLQTLEAIVVDVRYVNALYVKPYKPGVIETPSCWAISNDANVMVPHADAEKAAAVSCDDCPNNQFGSKGNGKACKNTIRLALLQPDATDKSPIFMLDLAPTSTTSFLKVIRPLTIPYQTVVMKFTLDATVDYPKIITNMIGPADDAVAPFLLTKIEQAQDPINRGFVFG